MVCLSIGVGIDLEDQISRAPSRTTSGGTDQWSLRTSSALKVVGRHVLNVWRIMRSEQSLTRYSFEHVTFHLLQRRSVIVVLLFYRDSHYCSFL